MTGRLKPERRRCRHIGALCAILALGAGCGDAPPAEESATAAESTESAEVTPDQAPRPELRRFLPDEMRRSTRAETFPHDPHRVIDCSVCHVQVRGHEGHRDVSCADCHRASAGTTLTSVTPDQCRACHHGPQQALGCAACHEPPPPLTSVQVLGFGVWELPRTRGLIFRHDLHPELDCARCHTGGPTFAPVSCASCHEVHHTEVDACSSCHQPPPPGAHGVEVHRGCSGTGCHSEPLVDARAETRSVCLFCHSEQQDHQPGAECSECHKLRGPVAVVEGADRRSGWHGPEGLGR